MDQEKRRPWGRAPFEPGLPVTPQLTIRSIQRQRQPLSQSNLPG
ncbi:hypothetical protein V8V75_21140 [Peribacillus frigoritolerans]